MDNVVAHLLPPELREQRPAARLFGVLQDLVVQKYGYGPTWEAFVKLKEEYWALRRGRVEEM